MSVGTELEKLASLRDRGILTDAEFESQKAQLLKSGIQPPSVDAAGPHDAAPRPGASARSPVKKTNRMPALIVGGLAAAVLAVVAIRVSAGMNEPASPAATASPSGQASPDAPAEPASRAPNDSAAADSAQAAVAAAPTTAPSNWCTPGVRLNVKASENSWYAGTVKRQGEAGLCVVGEDGWNAGWDRAVTVTQVAPEGSKVLFTGVGTAATATATNPDQLSVGVYACSTVSDNVPMPNLGWGIADASTYIDDQGAKGSYTYNSRLGQVDFTSGSLQGRIRRKDSSGLFHVVEADHLMNVACPYSPRDPSRGHW